METIKPSAQTLSLKGVAPLSSTPSQRSGNTEFNTFLKGVLTPDAANKVSEEDLFSALVQQRIKNMKGDEALKKFQETLGQSKEAMRRKDGRIPVEDATKSALIKAREAGILTKEETDKVYSESFAAAQLDDNKEVLYDNVGGGSDPTIAVALLDQAMMAASGVIEKFDDGSLTAPMRSVEESSNGKMFNTAGGGHSEGGGSAGFLYKPVSDTTGKLVVLMPSKLAGMVSSVKLYDPAGTLLDSGRFTGNGNGGRDHYRFKRTGGDYPDGLYVEVSLTTGDKVRYRIPESSQRTENINPANEAAGPSSTGSSGDTSGGQSGNNGSGTGGGTGSPDDSPNSL